MENLIFEIFLRIFRDNHEDFHRIFEEFRRNLFIVRRLRTSTEDLNLLATNHLFRTLPDGSS